MKKKQTFVKKAILFFEPIKNTKKEVFSLLLHDGILQLLILGIVSLMQYAADSILDKNLESFFMWISIMMAMGICIFVMEILRKPFLFVVWEKLRNALDGKFMPKLIHGDNNVFEALGTGKIIAIYSKGITTRANMIVFIFGDFFASFIFFGFFLSTIAFKNIYLFILFILLLILSGIIIIKFKYLSRKRRKLAKVKEIERQRIDVKRMMNKVEIMQQNRIGKELVFKQNANHERLDMKKKEKFFQGIVFDGVILLNTLFVLFTINIFGKQLYYGDITYGEMLTIITLGSLFIKEITQLGSAIRKIIDQYIDVEKLQELVKALKTSVNINKGNIFHYQSGDIALKNVSFTYDTSPVFKEFNLEIKGGTKTAFVGESGGGKTTLIKLLAGYIRPDQGEVEIDGQKLSDIKLTDYYKHIGYLTQDPSVFDGTIYENLVYALDTEPPTEDLEKVIQLAKCEFVREFEKGLETEIGERGVRLSGGQKQRLAIAKIMLKNPNIILLDEPTSALDSFNEELINIALHNLFKGKTVFIVAHRLQTVKQADRILLFEQGKILEEGTHDQLVKLNGKYKKMLDLQSGF